GGQPGAVQAVRGQAPKLTLLPRGSLVAAPVNCYLSAWYLSLFTASSNFTLASKITSANGAKRPPPATRACSPSVKARISILLSSICFMLVVMAVLFSSGGGTDYPIPSCWVRKKNSSSLSTGLFPQEHRAALDASKIPAQYSTSYCGEGRA